MSLGLEPGDLTEEVTVLEDVGSGDDGMAGRGAEDFQPLAADSADYAEVKAMGASSRLFAAKHGAPADYEVRLRYRADVDTRNRLRWDSNDARVLILVSGPVDSGQRQEWLVFRAREVRT